MPKTYSGSKSVKSFRLSGEGITQLRSMAEAMGRSESDILEVALDRMYREEIRFNRILRDRLNSENLYTTRNDEDHHGISRNDFEGDRENN
jgi:DNA-binding PadR family transcriptional regulator